MACTPWRPTPARDADTPHRQRCIMQQSTTCRTYRQTSVQIPFPSPHNPLRCIGWHANAPHLQCGAASKHGGSIAARRMHRQHVVRGPASRVGRWAMRTAARGLRISCGPHRGPVGESLSFAGMWPPRARTPCMQCGRCDQSRSSVTTHRIPESTNRPLKVLKDHFQNNAVLNC